MTRQELQQEIEKIVNQNQMMLQMQMLRKQASVNESFSGRRASVDEVRRHLDQTMRERELMAMGARASDGRELQALRGQIDQLMKEKGEWTTGAPAREDAELVALRKQLETLTKEKALILQRARDGVDAVELQDQIAALAKQNEQMRLQQGALKSQQDSEISMLQEQLTNLQKENVDLRQQQQATGSATTGRRRTSLSKIHMALNAGGVLDDGKRMVDLTMFRPDLPEEEQPMQRRAYMRHSTVTSAVSTMDLTAAMEDMDD